MDIILKYILLLIIKYIYKKNNYTLSIKIGNSE